ncbi:MAG: hypothetical protein H6R42_650, partial [Nitrospirae bacterium]|nr:hypothetical protein [Nitrospirota bacterium]
SICCKTEILRLGPQNDIATQSPSLTMTTFVLHVILLMHFLVNSLKRYFRPLVHAIYLINLVIGNPGLSDGKICLMPEEYPGRI